MTTRKQPELIDEILENLGILAAGQTANVEDSTRVQELLPSVQPFLAAKEIAYIPDFDNIPQGVFIPLAAVCAYVCHGKFGINGDELVTLKSNSDEAAKDLYTIYRGRPTYQPLKTDYI